jgi:putative Holliday junction resolvase
MNVLALDPGAKRIGLATADTDRGIALPLPAVAVRDDGAHLREIARLAAERRAERVVVGLPLRLDGTEGPAARAARAFADAVTRATGLPVEPFDERMTTAQAEREMIGLGTRRGRRRELIDSAAAVLLLQAWLDARRQDDAP